jgi:hypothetical protein
MTYWLLDEMGRLNRFCCLDAQHPGRDHHVLLVWVTVAILEGDWSNLSVFRTKCVIYAALDAAITMAGRLMPETGGCRISVRV